MGMTKEEFVTAYINDMYNKKRIDKKNKKEANIYAMVRAIAVREKYNKK